MERESKCVGEMLEDRKITERRKQKSLRKIQPISTFNSKQITRKTLKNAFEGKLILLEDGVFADLRWFYFTTCCSDDGTVM